MRVANLILFILIAYTASAQKNLGKSIPCYPYENKQVDTISLDGVTYTYKIMQTRSVLEDGMIKVLSEVIMPDFYADSDTFLVQKVINKIAQQTGSSEFAVFNDCKVREYYYSCKDLLHDEYIYYKKHFVGYYKSRNYFE